MAGLGILCPGQGDQTPDMFELFAEYEGAQRLLRAGAERLWGDPGALTAKLQSGEAFANTVAQPLVCLRQLVTWQTLAPLLPRPRLFAGYSLGEFAAYGCAGALPLSETLRLSLRRAALMDAAAPHATGLLALRGLNRDRVEGLCAVTGTEVAIVNGVDHFIVGGLASLLDELAEQAVAAGAQAVRRLPVTVPSHTSLLAAAGEAFREELAASALRSPPVPVLAGISGAVIRDRQQALTALAGQVCQPIRWDLCQQAALEMGCTVLLELGPGNALSRMVREIHPEMQVRAVDEFRSLQGVADWVAKQCR
jgi:[acyl-carrier-protein] S-malonyltransferase